MLRIRRSTDRAVVFTVSGRLKAENLNELCRLLDEERAGGVLVLDLTDLVLADGDAVRFLRECEAGERIVLRHCPAYIRVWMADDRNQP